MTGQQIRAERMRAEIPGDLLAVRAGIERSKVSRIERGILMPTPEEAARLEEALDALLGARERVAAVAAEVGWPL